jgi:glutamate synthase domain-containing protein 2
MLWLIAGLWGGLVTGVGLGLKFMIGRISGLIGKTDPTALVESLNLLNKLSWKNYFEANLRAVTGQPLSRPYGSRGAFFCWDRIIFSPVYYHQTPLEADVQIDTGVTLGPRSAKPLKLQIPILIGGMAYGSGYSAAAKIALAQAATLAGTAANTGNGPFLEKERRFAKRLIIQYTKGFWSKSATTLRQADMVEIALGHSARASAPVRIKGKKINLEIAERYGTIPGLDVLLEARLPEVETAADWRRLVQRLKELTEGAPVAVKFGASHYLETELDLFLAGGVDVVAFDGLEGGSHGGTPIFMDDIGLPLFPALCRVANLIRERGLQGQVSLIVGGGLTKPGDFAKCLALGADAVLLGTITALVQAHTQTTKTLPWEPPTELLYNQGKGKRQYQPEIGAKSLYHYFESCVREMAEICRTLGKSSLRELDRSDLVALDPLYATIAGIELATDYRDFFDQR